MANKQRARAAPSSKMAEMRKHSEDLSLILASSDDEAPEEVTFEDSKAQALRSMRHALDTVRREKEQLKEKRRRRQELFQEQKKRKLLPADVLEEIDSAPSKKQEESEEKDSHSAEDEQQEAEQKDEGEDQSKKKKSGKLAHTRTLRGNYRVRTVEDRAKASFQQQTAEEFIRSRLYGPGSCRTTCNELLSLQNKTGRKKSAAVQFVKKDWACKEKAKAEKLKKRWIHKQQIPSS